jgi:hypothetical protein
VATIESRPEGKVVQCTRRFKGVGRVSYQAKHALPKAGFRAWRLCRLWEGAFHTCYWPNSAWISDQAAGLIRGVNQGG